MGQEAACTVRVGSRRATGTARLETDTLQFRGDLRLDIPLQAVRSVAAEGGRLRVETADTVAEFDLGARAAAWARRIRSPPTLLDKLGIAAGSRVAVVGPRPDALDAELASRLAAPPSSRVGAATTHVIVGAQAREHLGVVARLAARMPPGAALWVVYPKGRPDPREADVLAAGRAAGLVDVKVARVSDTHTALKFVVPAARRAAGRR